MPRIADQSLARACSYSVLECNLTLVSASGLPRITLLCHGFLTILVPYLHSRIRAHALSRAWPDAPSKDRRRTAWDVLISTESLHTLLGLLNFVAFLWSGRWATVSSCMSLWLISVWFRYRTLADRLLQMQLVPSRGQVKRDISYEFMNRQMVWHAFTVSIDSFHRYFWHIISIQEFLIFLLPLLHGRSARRRLNKLFSYLNPSKLVSFIPTANRLRPSSLQNSSLSSAKRRGKFWSLPVDQCAICAENASFSFNVSESASMFTTLAPHASFAAEDPEREPPAYPINIPYIASCGDSYCYTCLTERLMRIAHDVGEEHGWECLRCTEEVTSANRYEVEITGLESGSDYEFSSDIDLDTTDISGSMGSYSESGLSDY